MKLEHGKRYLWFGSEGYYIGEDPGHDHLAIIKLCQEGICKFALKRDLEEIPTEETIDIIFEHIYSTAAIEYRKKEGSLLNGFAAHCVWRYVKDISKRYYQQKFKRSMSLEEEMYIETETKKILEKEITL